MDIAAVSVAAAQADLKRQAGIGVMKMAMDAGQRQAEALMEMIPPAVPGLGEAVDIKA